MQLVVQYDDLNKYLESNDIIDFGHSAHCDIVALSREIQGYSKNGIQYIKNAFKYVRDEILHSADIEGRTVTCKATEVLQAKEGICFAISETIPKIV